jgi:hypothetical protein
MLGQNLQSKILEIAVAMGAVDNGAIDAFHKAIGDPVLEIVEDLVPPATQGLDEFEQEAITGMFSFPRVRRARNIQPAVDSGSFHRWYGTPP